MTPPPDAPGRPGDPGPTGDGALGPAPAPDQRAKVVETHTGVLFFAGDRVVKIRRPVAFGFVDFTDRERRREDCEREVALNRRLAPDVYLGTATISMAGEPVEHAVVMRRLPESRSLAAAVAAGEPVDERIAQVAAKLARFHAEAARSAEIDRSATARSQWRRWRQTAADLSRFVGSTVDGALYAQATRMAGEYLAGRSALFERRIAEHAACDGHGDLQAADVFCLEDGPRLLDCLEFDDELRHADVLADVAFLALDLERLGVPEAAELLFHRYQVEAGGEQPPSLVHFYLAARAHVRLLVECLRAERGLSRHPVSGTEGALALMADHLRASRVRMVLVGGPPGSGKSTLAASLGQELGWTVLSSDHLRRSGAAPRAGYSDEARATVYDQLVRSAEDAARSGRSVLLDATWSEGPRRAAAAAAACRASAELIELRCACSADRRAARIAGRLASGTGESDVTPEVAAAMAAAEDRWPSARAVDTEGTAAQSRASAAAVLGGLGVRRYRPFCGGTPL